MVGHFNQLDALPVYKWQFFYHNKLECGPDLTPLVKSLAMRIINQLLQHTVYSVNYSEMLVSLTHIYFIAIILFLYTLFS